MAGRKRIYEQLVESNGLTKDMDHWIGEYAQIKTQSNGGRPVVTKSQVIREALEYFRQHVDAIVSINVFESPE